MKKLKLYENYHMEQFTEEDMELALLAMTEWIMDSIMSEGFDMSAQDKAHEIMQELKNKKMVMSVPAIKNKWKAIDLTASKDIKWNSTLTRRK